jgi:hypothetical protein
MAASAHPHWEKVRRTHLHRGIDFEIHVPLVTRSFYILRSPGVIFLNISVAPF